MDRKDFRTLLSKLSGASRITSHPSRAGFLLASVGRAMGTGGRAPAVLEALEGRALLEGSFASPIAAIALSPTTGRGVSVTGGGANAIDPAVSSSDNDFFTFIAPATDFVTVLADTSNEAPVSGLNTRVQIFDSNHVLVAQGSNNGTLTSHDYGPAGTPARDGWAGFVAQAGQTYFVVVSNDTGGTTAGTYTLRINALSTPVDIGGDLPTDTGIAREHNSPIPNPGPPPVLPTPILGQLGGTALPVTSRLREDNIVYKLVLPNDPKWDNLTTINAQSTRPAGANQQTSTRLDTHLEIYNAQGQLIASDSDTGRLQDAFTTVRSHPNDTFYVRVRSDEILNANIQLATGPFWLVIDALATVLPLDPVTRRGDDTGGAMAAFGPPTVPPNPNMSTPVFQTSLYEFTSQGSGLGIIVMRPTGLDPVVDGALRLYDATGTLVAFNDNFAGNDPEIEANLVGGARYFVVVDSFDVRNGSQFELHVESNHTFNNNGNPQPIDDHVNLPDPLPNNPTQAQKDAYRRQFELATALTWGPPTATFDADGNLVRDRGLTTTATGTGRIEAAGDTDLFQFTAPADMLQTYAGNNDDAGTALYTGGSFTVADPNNPWPTNTRDLAIWDAADWWAAGPQYTDPALGVTYGFQDNPNTPTTNRAEIYALYDWNPAPGVQPPAPGLTNHILVVGGDFNLVVPTAQGPVTIQNLAFFAQDPTNGTFHWDTGGNNNFGFNFGLGANGPVHAIQAYDPVAFDPDGTGPLPTIPDPNNSTIPDLFVGGSFTDLGTNLAFFRPTTGAWMAPGTGVNGTVFAMTVYDFADPGSERQWQAAQAGPPPVPEMRYVADTPDKPSSLIIGGQFTQAGGTAHANIATWNGVGYGAVASGRINAIAGNPGTPPNVPPFGGNEPNGDINGPVYALTVYDPPDPDGAGPIPDFGPLLVAGGQFTQAGGIAANNVATFGEIPFGADPRAALQDPANPLYAPQLTWAPIGGGITGATSKVLALTVYDPPDINNTTIDPLLVIGGDFAAQGNIIESNAFALGDPLGFAGTDGPVRALTIVLDQQEPGIQANLDSGSQVGSGGTSGPGQGVLYVGGDFTTVGVNSLAPVAAAHIAQFAANTGPNNPDDFFQWTALASGPLGGPGGMANTDPNAAPPTVFALTAFDDGNPYQWDRHDRAADKLQIVVNPVDGSFVNTRVRVYDSNFNLVYDFSRPGSESIAPPFPDPSGMLDPSFATPANAPGGGTNPQFFGISVWGGETYYVEIRDSSGGGTGRYSFTVTADAAVPNTYTMPDGTVLNLTDGSTRFNVNAVIQQPAKEGDFADALRINTNLQTGDGTNVANSATDPGQPLPFGNAQRIQHVTPSLNQIFTEGMDLGNISTIDDTELYYFRAEFTGTTEIRIQTIDIPDQFGEMLVDAGTGAEVSFAPLQKTLTSHLDAALRVYRNDFEQLAYEDDNPALAGERQSDNVGLVDGTVNDPTPSPLFGSPILTTFTGRDPRVVIPVVAGDVYYIQVESGQHYVDGSPRLIGDRQVNIPRETDARFVNGGYRLLVNGMPFEQAEIVNGQPVLDDNSQNVFYQDNQTPAQQHVTNAFSTVIPIGEDPNDPTNNGVGTINGVIRNTPLNPADLDAFTFTAPGSGTLNIRVSRTGAGNTLLPDLIVYQYSHVTGLYTFLGTGSPVTNGVVSFSTGALTGDVFFVAVDGSGNSQGTYRIDISGVPARDDTADFGKFWAAKDIPLLDFQGQGTVNGSIETRGDTDVYRFSVVDFANFGLNVTSHSASLNPAVTIYEVSEDPAGNPIFLRIGNNDGGGAGGIASVVFPVTPNRIEVVPPPGQNRTYPYYYVVVRGADPNADFGNYTLSLSFPPTDDHPDAPLVNPTTVDTSQFSFASVIPVDPVTGQGNASGNIELNTDTDLFSFDAPAGGPATVIISRPTGSTLRYSVSIVDATGHILASGTAPDSLTFTTASASTNVTRGTRYYVVVSPFNDPNNPNQVTTDTGLYTVSLTVPPVDDYPNAGEFSIAAPIPIDFSTGQGQLGGNAAGDPSNPRLSPANDTDLFTFTTVRQGDVAIRVTPFDTALGHFAPTITLFNAQGVQIQQVTATQPLQDTTLNLSNAPGNTQYYVLVSAAGGVPLATLTGEYRIMVVGPANPGGGTGGGVDSIDFNNPTTIALDQVTGDGQASDQINPSGDRDLYTFTTTAAGKVFVQLTAPNGSLLRASIRVLSSPNEQQSSEVVFDSTGIPGAIANVSFDGQANKQYWVVVDGLGDSTGSYTIKVATQPVVNRLVFPEGFASDTIREFVSIVNPGDVTATYTVFLRYESGDLQTQVTTATIAPHSRGGLTIIDGKNYQTPGIRLNTPYSVVLESDQPLGATLAHYDFGHSIGDSFTGTATPTWSFARVERTPGTVMDFVVFYNVNNFDVTATLTAYDSTGAPHSLTRTFGAERRGGFSINDITNFPIGVFGATLTVVNAATGAPAQVVASLSHYNTAGDAAFGLLGDPNGGSTNGILTNISQGTRNNGEMDFFNPGTSPVTVHVVGSYIRTPLPQFTKDYTVAPKQQLKIAGSSLGISPDQPVGIRYSTDGGPIVAGSDQVQLGDADSTEPGTSAGTRAFFGDAFIDTRSAGINYFETLWLANPSSVASTINVKLDFLDGSTALIPVSVAAHGFAELRLHQRPEILSTHTGPTWYSIDVSSAIPFVASMTHYDLTLGGGWSTSGVPFGITEPLNTIT